MRVSRFKPDEDILKLSREKLSGVNFIHIPKVLSGPRGEREKGDRQIDRKIERWIDRLIDRLSRKE